MRAGQLLRAAEEYQSVAEAVADCALVVGTSAVAHREPCHPVLSLDTAAPLLRAGLRRARVAILFGSEKTGLSNEDLSYCHWLLRIPTRSEHVSMNLGQAVAVCVYELARPFQTQELSQPAEVPAAAGELDRMTDAVMEVLDNSGYIKPTSTEATREKIRRLIRRLNLSGEDVGIWLGIYRQIAWKLRADRE
jgi:tRNA/rRNA methyltransferase